MVLTVGKVLIEHGNTLDRLCVNVGSQQLQYYFPDHAYVYCTFAECNLVEAPAHLITRIIEIARDLTKENYMSFIHLDSKIFKIFILNQF